MSAGTGAVPVAVLISGGGRTLANLLARAESGRLDIRVAAVAASRADAGGVAVARAAGLPVEVFRRRDHADPLAHSAAVNAWLAPFAPRLILLAGWLCWYAPPAGFAGPVLNIHPALLPRHGGRGMYGDRVHAAVLAAGDRESGCTVHRVDAVYDHGEILGQRRVPVLPGDDVHTLAARVFAAECELYPAVVAGLVAAMKDGGA